MDIKFVLNTHSFSKHDYHVNFNAFCETNFFCYPCQDMVKILSCITTCQSALLTRCGFSRMGKQATANPKHWTKVVYSVPDPGFPEGGDADPVGRVPRSDAAMFRKISM